MASPTRRPRGAQYLEQHASAHAHLVGAQGELDEEVPERRASVATIVGQLYPVVKPTRGTQRRRRRPRPPRRQRAGRGRTPRRPRAWLPNRRVSIARRRPRPVARGEQLLHRGSSGARLCRSAALTRRHPVSRMRSASRLTGRLPACILQLVAFDCRRSASLAAARSRSSPSSRRTTSWQAISIRVLELEITERLGQHDGRCLCRPPSTPAASGRRARSSARRGPGRRQHLECVVGIARALDDLDLGLHGAGDHRVVVGQGARPCSDP